MTNEEMLQRVNELALHLEKEERDLYHDCVANGLHVIPGFAGALASLTLTLRDDIAQEEARKSGRGSAQTAAKRIIKNAIARQVREYLHGAWMENGKQCLCDGYCGVILDSPIPGLAQAKTEPEKLDLNHIMAPSRKNDGAKLTLPTVGELKAAIKVHDAEERARKAKAKDRTTLTWNFGGRSPGRPGGLPPGHAGAASRLHRHRLQLPPHPRRHLLPGGRRRRGNPDADPETARKIGHLIRYHDPSTPHVTKEENTMTTYTLALAITGIISLSTGFMRLLSRLEGDFR